jgi:predicted nucleic acid-binding protein
VIVVDASCLVEILIGGPLAQEVERRLLDDGDHVAPHIIDVETFGIIRRLRISNAIDETLAALAIEDLRLWPGERFGHRALLDRAWELRENVRGWDAMYVALAEILEAPLLTLDGRLARASGPRCVIDLVVG